MSQTVEVRAGTWCSESSVQLCVVGVLMITYSMTIYESTDGCNVRCKNKMGPRTGPCGAPELTRTAVEVDVPMLTDTVLPDIYESIQLDLWLKHSAIY